MAYGELVVLGGLYGTVLGEGTEGGGRCKLSERGKGRGERGRGTR